MLRHPSVLVRLAIALLAWSCAEAAAADSWAMPERHSYFSPDRQLG